MTFRLFNDTGHSSDVEIRKCTKISKDVSNPGYFTGEPPLTEAQPPHAVVTHKLNLHFIFSCLYFIFILLFILVSIYFIILFIFVYLSFVLSLFCLFVFAATCVHGSFLLQPACDNGSQQFPGSFTLNSNPIGSISKCSSTITAHSTMPPFQLQLHHSLPSFLSPSIYKQFLFLFF